jgi:hypothetical protein
VQNSAVAQLGGTCAFSAGPPPKETCTLAALPGGGKWTITIKVTVTAPAGTTLKNTATVKANEHDPSPGTDTSTTKTKMKCPKGGCKPPPVREGIGG